MLLKKKTHPQKTYRILFKATKEKKHHSWQINSLHVRRILKQKVSKTTEKLVFNQDNLAPI